jgi:hypothetical protein
MSINQVAEKIETQVPEAKAQAYQAIGYVTGVLDISDFKKPTPIQFHLTQEPYGNTSLGRLSLFSHILKLLMKNLDSLYSGSKFNPQKPILLL